MTAPATPSSNLGDAISDAVKRHLEARNAAIEAALVRAVRLGVGVRVKDYQDGRTEVAVDPTVPAWNIYQEYPDRPHYGMRFEDD